MSKLESSNEARMSKLETTDRALSNGRSTAASNRMRRMSDIMSGIDGVSFGFRTSNFIRVFELRHSSFEGIQVPLRISSPTVSAGSEPAFLHNALISLDELRCIGRFYLQRGLRLRRFAHLSGNLRDVRKCAGRRSLTRRARFCRRLQGSREPGAAMDRRKNGSGQRLAARSTRPAEPRKRVANLLGAWEIGRRLAFSSAQCGSSRSGARSWHYAGRVPAECTTD